jgi:ribosomal protein S18 acetylase RimI-like enzyme
LKKKKTTEAPRGKFNPALIKIRKAKVGDIPQLIEVENACFDYDQLSRRNFHWMIKKAHSIFMVLEYKSKLIGYGLVLINRGTSLARLYSICTLSEYQGFGLASKLISCLEKKAADDEDCAYLRLEVKENNKSAIKLYEKLGYVKFTEKDDYYDDGKAALCYEKRIRYLKPNAKTRVDIPYYQQGTEFTCGPATLLMAMKTLNPKVEMNLTKELQIWREATTIFMTSGHGGCGPHGLALSAWRRGYKAELYISHNNVLFLGSVRTPEKKNIIELVHKDFEKKVSETNIKLHKKRCTLQDLKEILKKGGIPLVLITTYHFDNNRAPHWVVVTAYDDGFVYIHDPDQFHTSEHLGVISRVHIPIPEDQFLKISRWGRDKLAAAVVVYSD